MDVAAVMLKEDYQGTLTWHKLYKRGFKGEDWSFLKSTVTDDRH